MTNAHELRIMAEQMKPANQKWYPPALADVRADELKQARLELRKAIAKRLGIDDEVEHDNEQ